MRMATLKERQIVKLFNEVQRNYNALVQCDEQNITLLCYFKDQLNLLVELFDEIEIIPSTLSEKLADDIKSFIHDVDLSFFGGYKETFCTTNEEHTAIETIWDIVDDFRYIYPLDLNKPQYKPSKTVQADNKLSEVCPTDEAKKILDAAVNVGLLTEIPGTNQYNWNETKPLLVYFILKANAELGYLGEKVKSQENDIGNGKENRIEWSKWGMITQVKGKSLNIGSLTVVLSEVRNRHEYKYTIPQRANKIDEDYSWKKKFRNVLNL